jgi:hypothetical protein
LVELADARVGDPALDAVEDPVVAVADGAGGHGRGVRAGLGLGEAVGEHRVAGGHGRQVAALQFLGGVEEERQRAELVDGGDERGGGAGARDLFDDDGGAERVDARAAVLGGDVRGVEVGGLERLVGALGEGRGRVGLGGVGGDPGVADVAGRRPDVGVLFWQLVGGEPGGHQWLPRLLLVSTMGRV